MHSILVPLYPGENKSDFEWISELVFSVSMSQSVRERVTYKEANHLKAFLDN